MTQHRRGRGAVSVSAPPQTGMRMSCPGFGLNLCLQGDASKWKHWDDKEEKLSNNAELTFSFVSLCMMNQKPDRKLLLSCSCLARACKDFPGVCLFPLCNLKHNHIINRDCSILSFQLSVLEWALVSSTPASFISHFMPWHFSLKTASCIFQHCPLDLAASFSLTHSILF